MKSDEQKYLFCFLTILYVCTISCKSVRISMSMLLRTSVLNNSLDWIANNFTKNSKVDSPSIEHIFIQSVHIYKAQQPIKSTFTTNINNRFVL